MSDISLACRNFSRVPVTLRASLTAVAVVVVARAGLEWSRVRT